MRLNDSDHLNNYVPDAEFDLSGEGSMGTGRQSVDFFGAILRYRWAVLLPALLGLCVGGGLWTQLPEVYESSSRILVESDKPIILDATTGETIQGVPSAEVIQAQLFSDSVLTNALTSDLRYSSEEISQILETEYNGSFGAFAVDSVTFESENDSKTASNSLAFQLAVRHTSEDLVDAASQSITAALIKYFDDRRQSSIVELRDYIEKATGKYAPKLAELERKHREFQRLNPLEFDETGNAINPHRVNILALKETRNDVQTTYDELSSDLSIIEATLRESSDTRTAIDIVGQYLEKELVTPIERRRLAGIKEEDFDIKRLGFEEQLVPLMVARQRAAEQFDENHPTVKSLDSEIRYSKQEFEKLSRAFTDRMKELLDDSEKEMEEARQACVTIVTALRAQLTGLKLRLQDIDKSLEIEKLEAEKLAAAEQENASYLREIAQAKDLLDTLKEQMARLNLADKQAGVALTLLNKPTKASVVGPNLLLLLAGGLGVGLMFGCGLAYLLESQAGTFRNADEISNYLRVQILSHIPFDPGRRGKVRKGEEDSFVGLDDKLCVLHRPSSMAAEAVRACRTAVFFEAANREARVIQVTSPLPSDGKTTLAGNLAVSIAHAGKRVIIVDCDLRRPQISDNFALGEAEGLTNVLNGDCDPESVVHETPIANLCVMPSGPIPMNPAEALTLPAMHELLDWLKERFDYVIVDTPPLLVVTDPSIVASMVDGVVVTMKVRRKSKSNSREAINILRGLGANILGVVINASDDMAGSDGYKGYGYYKYSRYASKYNVTSGYSGKRSGRNSKYLNGKGTLIVGAGGTEGRRQTSQNGSSRISNLTGSGVDVIDPERDDE